MPPTPMGDFPAILQDRALWHTLPAAVAASGGCTVTATIGTARMDITYVPRNVLSEDVVDEAWASGTISAGTRKARVVAHWWLSSLEGTAWLDDGTPDRGKAWVQVPASLRGLRDLDQAKQLVRAHPLLPLVPMLQARMPDGLWASDMAKRSAQLVGTETIDGEATGHYTWTTQRGRRTDLWLGRDWLPRRQLAPIFLGSTPMTATVTYQGWGSVSAVQSPPGDQIAVVPTLAETPS